MLDIRAARVEDAAALSRVVIASLEGDEFSGCQSAQAVAALVAESRPEKVRGMIEGEQGMIYCAEIGGEVLGYLRFDYGYLHALYVHPQAKKKGVGTALMQVWEDWLQKHHIIWLKLRASPNAQKFYKKKGFLVAGGACTSDEGVVFTPMQKFLL